ncbi:MarR family winged helix-turn-helix transcriptional regulator [Anaerofustis butyriciformans]|uniref:MarR family winged helix-turn-helix transcriptional regulator n=1 Tax=Anaerofustis butyriciformans TaxID=3108533 RepID=UPI003F8B20EF
MKDKTVAKNLFMISSLMQSKPIKKIEKVTLGEMAVLGFFIYEKDEATPTQLSERFKLSTARIANTLNSLEKKEYINRFHSSEDRRKVTVKITQKGKNIFEKMEEDALKEFNKLLEFLGDEDSSNLLRIIEKLNIFMQNNN